MLSSMGKLPLSKKDRMTEEQKTECSKYPYRRVIRQLIFGMVHTLVTLEYALKISLRYGNNPGPRRDELLKQIFEDGFPQVLNTW